MVSKKIGILFFISVILAFFSGYFVERILPSSPTSNNDDMFTYIIESFNNYYYYDIDSAEVHEAFIANMEATIQKIGELNDDPYTRLLAVPLESGDTDEEKFTGIGISFYFEDDLTLRVTDVYRDGGAYLHIYPNDVIIGVVENTESIYFNTLKYDDEVLDLIAGNLGDEKTFIVLNPDGNEEEVTITYQEIFTPTVSSVDLGESDIAYIKIRRFSGASESTVGTASVFQTTLNTLEQTILTDETKTLIIDLRNNPGGALSALHNQGYQSLLPGITQQLLIRNLEKPLFTMIPRTNEVQSFYGGLSQAKPYDIKVLINEHSASASEVLAAALQSIGGYELYGRPSYGKGVYQNQVALGVINNVRYYLVYTEGEWYYGDQLNVSDNPLDVNLINPTGIKNIEMPLYAGEMSFDHVYESLANYQAFLNIYYGLTGEAKLREDGYFDQKTKDIVAQFNVEHELSGDAITIDTAHQIYKRYVEMMNNITYDDELQTLISEIKSS